MIDVHCCEKKEMRQEKEKAAVCREFAPIQTSFDEVYIFDLYLLNPSAEVADL